MKKDITILFTIASLLIILDSINGLHMIMMFLFVGIIPGTDIALNPNQMLFLMASLTFVVLYISMILPIYRKIKLTITKNAKLSPNIN